MCFAILIFLQLCLSLLPWHLCIFLQLFHYCYMIWQKIRFGKLCAFLLDICTFFTRTYTLSKLNFTEFPPVLSLLGIVWIYNIRMQIDDFLTFNNQCMTRNESHNIQICIKGDCLLRIGQCFDKKKILFPIKMAYSISELHRSRLFKFDAK